MTTADLMGEIKTFSLEMITRVCPTCGIPFAIPSSYYTKLKENHVTFYCPNGHPMWHAHKSTAEELADKLKNTENQVAQLQTAKIQLEGQLKKVSEGKCPCCGKTFKSLQKHLVSRHPNYSK